MPRKPRIPASMPAGSTEAETRAWLATPLRDDLQPIGLDHSGEHLGAEAPLPEFDESDEFKADPYADESDHDVIGDGDSEAAIAAQTEAVSSGYPAPTDTEKQDAEAAAKRTAFELTPEQEAQRSEQRKLFPNNWFTVQPAERPYLIKASHLGKSAAMDARRSCNTAECTQGEHEAATLEGYSKENIEKLERASGTDFEAPTMSRLALLTGLRIYHGEIEKQRERDGKLLVDESAAVDVSKLLDKLLRRFHNQTDISEDMEEETEEINGGLPTDEEGVVSSGETEPVNEAAAESLQSEGVDFPSVD